MAARYTRRVLFLDVDGVLNCSADMRTGRSDVLRPTLLKRLGALVREADASLVLSSSWRAYPGLVARLRDALKAVAGVDETAFVGMTGQDQAPGGCEGRAKEIEKWLEENMGNGGRDIGGPIEAWCVLDDLPMGALPFLAGHFVRVDPRIGLSERDAEQATRILLSRRRGGGGSRVGAVEREERVKDRARASGADEAGAESLIAKSIDQGVANLAGQYNAHLQQVERENQLAEVERLRRAKAALLKTGGEEDEVGCGVATDVLYDTGTSFLALSPRLVVEMLDRRIATME